MHTTGGFEHSVGGQGCEKYCSVGVLVLSSVSAKSSSASVILSCASAGKLKKLDMQPATHMAMCS